jgi:hypothetical protein
MVDPSPNPIPEELRQAFREAFIAFRHWDRGGSEPEGISLWGAPRTISFVCDAAEPYGDSIPDDLYGYLCGEAENADTTSSLLQGDRSYRAGAPSLYRMVRRRGAHYEAASKL